jgi:hypothetical protein
VGQRIEQLKQVVERTFQCKARHVASRAVVEGFEGQVVVDGIVDVFDLEQHPKAARCYAFRYLEDDGRVVIKKVLGVPPVDSEVSAVRTAIAGVPRR